jgi:hypothetical protein
LEHTGKVIVSAAEKPTEMGSSARAVTGKIKTPSFLKEGVSCFIALN